MITTILLMALNAVTPCWSFSSMIAYALATIAAIAYFLRDLYDTAQVLGDKRIAILRVKGIG